MRGAASSANAVRPWAAIAAILSASNGFSMPTMTVPDGISVRSSAEGARTLSTSSQPNASAAEPIAAPAA